MAVVASLELDDQVAFSEPARQANRGHGGVRSGVDEADHFDRGNCFRDFLAKLYFERGSHAEAGAAGSLIGNSGDNIGMRMPQDQGAPGTHKIDVLAAVNIVKTRALGMVDYERRASYGAEGADRAVDSAYKSFLAALENFG